MPVRDVRCSLALVACLTLVAGTAHGDQKRGTTRVVSCSPERDSAKRPAPAELPATDRWVVPAYAAAPDSRTLAGDVLLLRIGGLFEELLVSRHEVFRQPVVNAVERMGPDDLLLAIVCPPVRPGERRRFLSVVVDSVDSASAPP